MNILELIQKRYTAKHYQSDKAIPQDKIEELKEILRLTPSSINIQPWKFTFVQNPEMKAILLMLLPMLSFPETQRKNITK